MATAFESTPAAPGASSPSPSPSSSPSPRRRAPAPRRAFLTQAGAAALLLGAWARPGRALGVDNDENEETFAIGRRGNARPEPLPEGARVEQDVAYGDDPRQRLDLYLPASPASGRPVVLMVHGGAWMIGGKDQGHVVGAKAARWLRRGVAFAATNYRLSRRPDVRAQADDVAKALALLQREGRARWALDTRRLLLMGHSAGAHLAALVTADASLRSSHRLEPWAGTVALDSAALDVERVMQEPHPRFYDNVFGRDPARWRAVSPLHRISGEMPPLLAVCSQQRRLSCAQAEAFAERAKAAGQRVEVAPVALGHGAINAELGREGDYTNRVEGFMRAVGVL
jgi:acetyl esterase/lipase